MNIYVGRLPRLVNEAKLRELFEQYGAVDSIKLIQDRMTGQLRGFAFVEMPESDQAQEAIAALNGAEFDGQRLVVSEARPRDNNGGGRSGGPRGDSRFGGRSRFNSRY